MKRTAIIAASVLLALGAAACAPITSYNGFQAQDVKPEQIKVGDDSRSTVLTKLGSPSVQAAFDANIWFYVSQVSDKYSYYKPRVRQRQIVEIRFDKEEKVTLVKSYVLTDGYVVAYDKRETPTRGRELSVIEQILGGLGRGGLMPQDNDPGNPRGPGR
jgi:outer membrane protein assembly factor BamE (lipoprotein component of BamABCDE complex)